MFLAILLWLLVFVEGGTSPVAAVWGLASLELSKHTFTTLEIWTVSAASYVLHGCLLEWIPGKMLQSNGRPLSLDRMMPVVLLNFMSTLVLTMVPLSTEHVLTTQEVCTCLVVAGLGNEFIYAPVHRMLHTRRLYRFHHTHHLQRAPRALGAIYCSLVEMWVANLSSFLIPLYMMNASSAVYLIWIVSGIQTTQLHHSGKRYFWCLGNQPKFHDDHHRYVSKNYGNLGILESLLHTAP